MYEVYKTTKPAVRGRSLVMAGGLLFLATVLAGLMSSARTGDPLGARVAPPGWDVSFRPPRRLTLGEPAGSHRQVIRYHEVKHGGATTLLLYWRSDPAPDMSAEEIARRDMTELTVTQSEDHRQDAEAESQQSMGPLQAYEIIAPRRRAILRIAFMQPEQSRSPIRVAYTVAMLVDGGPLDDELYTLFDLTCRSFELR